MKPTPQITSKHVRRSFPLTNYALHSTVGLGTTAASSVAKSTRSLAFHKLSSGFLGKEANQHFVVELVSFAVISAISGWCIVSSVVAMVRLVRNY